MAWEMEIMGLKNGHLASNSWLISSLGKKPDSPKLTIDYYTKLEAHASLFFIFALFPWFIVTSTIFLEEINDWGI